MWSILFKLSYASDSSSKYVPSSFKRYLGLGMTPSSTAETPPPNTSATSAWWRSEAGNANCCPAGPVGPLGTLGRQSPRPLVEPTPRQRQPRAILNRVTPGGQRGAYESVKLKSNCGDCQWPAMRFCTLGHLLEVRALVSFSRVIIILHDGRWCIGSH